MGELIMELKNVTKYFPGVIALNDMSFQCGPVRCTA